MADPGANALIRRGTSSAMQTPCGSPTPASTATPLAATPAPSPTMTSGGPCSQYAATIEADGATQYFQLGEVSGTSAYNAASNGAGGTYIGTVGFGASGPLLNVQSNAISLPGGSASAGVYLPSPNAVAGRSYTLQTWVRPASASNYLTIWGADGRRRLMIGSNGLLLSQFSANFFSKTALSRNQWHDVVFVYDAATSTQSYYIDGQYDSSAQLSHSAAAFTSNYYLGQYGTGAYYKFEGNLAQHALYPTALSAVQIAQLHTTAGYIVAPEPTAAPTSTAWPSPTAQPTAVGSPMPTASPTPPGAVVTIPYWQSSFSYGGKTYVYKMAGSNPMSAPAATSIGDQIVPVQLTFTDGTIVDATAAAAAIPSSPLFTNNVYAAGDTQYGDAFMRSEFWQYVQNQNYHVLLAPPALEPTVRLSVPAADGYTALNSDGVRTGYVTYSWFVQTIEPQIIAQLGIDPRTLTIFATYHTKVLEPGNHCCYAGYHSSFPMTTSLGNSIATTAWASVTSNSVITLSHEISEWLDDPFYTNDAPSWINPISKICNGNELEVGDPVTNYTFTVGGWWVQDEVFYSWFTRDAPSIGVNGNYDLMGKLASSSSPC